MTKKYWKHSNTEDLEVQDSLEVEEKEAELAAPEDSGYIVVRRITYGINSTIVPVGAPVPMEVINDSFAFNNLLSKGAIVKRGE